jgi:hypothetical protein
MMLDRLRDATKAFRYVLSGDPVVVNVTIKGKLELDDPDRALLKYDADPAE